MKPTLLFCLLVLTIYSAWARPTRSLTLKAASTKLSLESHPTLTANTIRYVKAGASGSGASWSNASGDFQAMINASAPGDQVWVAGGLYKPNTGGLSDPRSAHFSLKNGVSVLGGSRVHRAPMAM